MAPAGSATGFVPGPLVLLSPSQLIANGLLIPLEAPDVGVPKLSVVSGPLHCSTAVPPDAADLAYVWRRERTVIPGTGADHVILPADEGHALSCTATATNAWGSTTGSSAPYRVTVTGAAARARLALTGVGSERGSAALRSEGAHQLAARRPPAQGPARAHLPHWRARRRPRAGLPDAPGRRDARPLARRARAEGAGRPRSGCPRHALTSTSAALWPPKPKLFESDARTSTPRRAAPIT